MKQREKDKLHFAEVSQQTINVEVDRGVTVATVQLNVMNDVKDEHKQMLLKMLLNAVTEWETYLNISNMQEPNPVEKKDDFADLLKRKDVCDIFRISSTTLWKLQKSGVLSPCKIGGRVLFRKSDILKLIEQ